jgi:4-alpha-glucanotransferase
MTPLRTSGVLLHPTSLPGPYGIGELGEEADAFADWLADAGQSIWQVLPLGPTGYGDSPYQSFSSFAGNPLLISLEALAAGGYLSRADLEGAGTSPFGPFGERPPSATPKGMTPHTAARVTGSHALAGAGSAFLALTADFGRVIPWKTALLRRAALAFQGASPESRAEFETFCAEHAGWLDDYALFAALKEHFGGAVWNAWPQEIARREAAALEKWSKALAACIHERKFEQWQFCRQWRALKAHANERGVRLFGDVPIFVAHDSADVWAHPEQYYLDDTGNPTVVAGVPPDYFSATGQLWGNPLYRWDVMVQRGFDWWIERMRRTLENVDIVRMDHFRGFEAYWEVPAGAQTAATGSWVPGPGSALFDAILEALPGTAQQIVAEDLGVITPPVIALRERYGFPGMKILQFAFGPGADNPLPHTFERNSVAYTGTHDNDTAMGWFANASTEERRQVLDYMGTDGTDFAWDLIRLGSMSVANSFIVPMQDLLSLGSEARMNFPSKASGNWGWRMGDGAATPELAARLRKLTEVYGRNEVKEAP